MENASSAESPPASAVKGVPNSTEARVQAAVVRRHAGAVARAATEALGGELRPRAMAPEPFADLLTAGFRDLTETLALALEVGMPELLTDDLSWLAGMLAPRGYDGPAVALRVYDAFAGAVSAVCPAAAAAAARPVLDAGRQALCDLLAGPSPAGL